MTKLSHRIKLIMNKLKVECGFYLPGYSFKGGPDYELGVFICDLIVGM